MYMWKYYLRKDEISDRHLGFLNSNLFVGEYVLWAWTCDKTKKSEFERYRNMNKFKRVKTKLNSSEELTFYLNGGRDDVMIITNDFEDRYDIINLATTATELYIVNDGENDKFSELFSHIGYPLYVAVLNDNYKRILDYLLYYTFSVQFYSEDEYWDIVQESIGNLDFGYTFLGAFVGQYRMNSYLIFVEEFFYLLEVK